MITKVRVNDNVFFKLVEFSAAGFASDQTLRLQSDDLHAIKDAFTSINKLEIFVNDNPAGTYTQYDTYSSVTYEGKVFVAQENIFADCMRIELQRSSLVDEVAALTEMINPTIDIEAMTTEEYRKYLLKQIGAACRDEIYAGTQVELTDGTIEYYTYDDDDQRNLTNAVIILIVAPEARYVPYHPSGGYCRMIPSIDLLNIYGTLQVRLTYLVTRCNYLTKWIRTMTTKEELLEVNWKTELPEEYQQQVNEIYSQALQIFEKIKARFLPPVEESEEPTDETTE